MFPGLGNLFNGKCCGNNARENIVTSILEKLEKQLLTDGTCLNTLFVAIEGDGTQKGVLRGFHKLNNYFRFLLRIYNKDNFAQVRRSLKNFGTSEKFEADLARVFS